MSYTALVTIISPTDLKYCLTTRLGDEWSEGEKLAETIGRERSFNEAMIAAHHAAEASAIIVVRKSLTSDLERAAWADTWADETWTVEFTPHGEEDTLVTVTGHDAGGTQIFYRRTLRG